jgi:hypothetical protein
MNTQIQWVVYALLSVPGLLVFVIVNLWLCLQIKLAWRTLTGNRSYSNGYTSSRASRSEKVRSREANGASQSEPVTNR